MAIELEKTHTSPPTKKNVFFSRLLSSTLLWGLTAAAIFLGNQYLFFVVLFLFCLFGVIEFFHIVQQKEAIPYSFKILTAALGGIYLLFCFYLFSQGEFSQFLRIETECIGGILLLLASSSLWINLPLEKKIPLVFTSFMGFIYIFFLFNFITKILFLETINQGIYYIFLLLVISKFSDMGAYCVGSLLGKHKMVPSISPKKTWEGFGGALITSLLGGTVIFFLFSEKLAPLTYADTFFLSLLLSLFAIAGDLFESLFKRHYQVKDAGTILPGIGGVLDLIDSLLFTAPIFYLYLSHQ